MARTEGVELLNRLHDGTAEVAPPEILLQTRDEVSVALEELIEVGARVRPLLVENQRVGWVRGVHLAERRRLRRWITNETEFIEILLSMGSTLTREDIRNLTLVEVRSLSRLVKAMSESDLSLYPFISAFVTTNRSEQLWYSHGVAATAFSEREVRLPDGKRIQVSLPSDQARLWAFVCNYRIAAKQRLEASMNAVLTIRPLVGKGADPLANDLKAVSRSLITDILDPWRELVRHKNTPNLDDGWAHSNDDSIEGMRRELQGMVNNDRHERVFEAFDKQTREREAKKQEQVASRIAARGGPWAMDGAVSMMTAAEVADRARRLREGTESITTPQVEEPQSSPEDRLAKYK